MARFGFAGGSRGGSKGGASRSSRASSGRGSSRAGSKGGGKRLTSSKAAKSVRVYSLYDSNGKRTYVGSTNNPARRASEHAKSGKLAKGGKLKVESKSMSRQAAQRLEAKKIQGYRQRTGSLPKFNRTSTGQYRFWD